MAEFSHQKASARGVTIAFDLAAVIVLWAALAPQTPPARSRPATETKVPMDLSMQVGSDALAGQVQGTCEHADIASIYGVRAEMWRVRYESGDQRAVQLTLWRPKDGSEDMMTLSVTLKGDAHSVNTVPGGHPVGSGKVTLERSGKGGTFKIDAKTAEGKTVTGTITCQAFTPAVAVGG